jgi:hypothetical protein
MSRTAVPFIALQERRREFTEGTEGSFDRMGRMGIGAAQNLCEAQIQAALLHKEECWVTGPLFFGGGLRCPYRSQD